MYQVSALRNFAALLTASFIVVLVPISANGQIFGSAGIDGVQDGQPGVPFTLDFTTGPQTLPFDVVGFTFILSAPSFTTVDIQFDDSEPVSFEPFSTSNGVSSVGGLLEDIRLQEARLAGDFFADPGTAFALLPSSFFETLSDGLVDVTITFPDGASPQGPITFSGSPLIVIPEPGSLTALGVIAAALVPYRRKKR